jgi:capsule polysaccharide export protein KpsC/LpsZ
MYIEHYSAYIANATLKRIRKVKVQADTVIDAHKKIMLNTNLLSEEIVKIVDSHNITLYTLKDGFLEPTV